MGFSRQEYWSGLPFPSPEDPPEPGIESRSPAMQADALTSEPPGKRNQFKSKSYQLKHHGTVLKDPSKEYQLIQPISFCSPGFPQQADNSGAHFTVSYMGT